MKPFMPRRAKYWGRKDHLQLFLLGLGAVYEGLVVVLSLGYLTVDTRAWMLFDLFEDD
jgi:hypothetical protein